MASPGSPALQRLHSLDKSSPDFHDRLSNTLYGQEYYQCVPRLQGDDLVWLVNYLDKALDCLDPSSPASRKCLRELRSICGTGAILPTSYTLSPRSLNVGPDPFNSGGFGDVYHGTLDGARICVKRVRVYIQDGPQKAAKIFCQEAVMWKRLTHPNILPLLGVTITPLQLISNWMPGGNLSEYIRNNSDADRLALMSDVAKGLCYLHSCNVIHGDLKGLNILVDSSGHGRIADFGLTTITKNLDSLRSVSRHNANSPRWSAPEVLNEGTHSKESDIFSFAMVMIEVFTGAVPFSDLSSFMAMLAITQDKRPPRPTHPTFTENLWTLVQHCWNQDPHLRPEASRVLEILLPPEDPAWQRLISNTLAAHERISLIEKMFSSYNQVETTGHLSADDAQILIDVIDEVLDGLAPLTRSRCLNYSYRICGHQAVVPRSLEIPLCYDPTADPLYRGAFADVRKGRHNGREVVAKALRLSMKDDFGPIRKKFCREVVMWKALRHPNVLPLIGVSTTENRLVIVSEWMGNGNIIEFLEANVDADWLGLLAGVTRGLIYMHDQGMIHGNLKGANVLIDKNRCARLADFSLPAIFSDESIIASTAMVSSNVQWMSQELLFPEEFGLKESRPTKESDCYALGMVICEVLSRQVPFAQLPDPVVLGKVQRGELPERPQGEGGKLFIDGMWGILERCWKRQPGERISAKAVLLDLEGSTVLPMLSSNTGGDVEMDSASDFRPTIAYGDDGVLIRA